MMRPTAQERPGWQLVEAKPANRGACLSPGPESLILDPVTMAWVTRVGHFASALVGGQAVAARALLDTLSADQLAIVQLPDLSDATRTKWTSFPAGAMPRPGLGLGETSDQERMKVHLLRVSTSSHGYVKLTGAIRTDRALGEIEGRPGDVIAGPVAIRR